VKEGGSKGCKNGWVSLQHRLLSPIFICIYIIWFLPSLQEIHFQLCNFFHYDGDLKTSWRIIFLLWLSCFLHHTLCHINIILLSFQANPFISFLFYIFWLQVTIILDILLLCNIGLYTKDRHLLWLISIFACSICFVWRNSSSSTTTSWWIVWRSRMITWSWVLSKVHMTTTWWFSRHLKHLLPNM
jgi:hypothetical protein